MNLNLIKLKFESLIYGTHKKRSKNRIQSKEKAGQKINIDDGISYLICELVEQ